jgi:hypothetical protein
VRMARPGWLYCSPILSPCLSLTPVVYSWRRAARASDDAGRALCRQSEVSCTTYFFLGLF